eukprot:501169-Prorocentrum_minimum.AAC.1
MKRSRQGLGENVRAVVLGVHVVANVDVLGLLGVVHVILGDESCVDVVDVRLDRGLHGDNLVDQ